MSAGRRARGRPDASPVVGPHGRAARDAGAPPAPQVRGDRAATAAATALVVVVLGTAILVDVRAEAAFDAPKRVVTMLGLAAAAASLARGAVRRTRTASAPSGTGREPTAAAGAAREATATSGASAGTHGATTVGATSVGVRGAGVRTFASDAATAQFVTVARRTIAVALGVAGVGALVATLASPRPEIARDALRALVIFALALPLGASRALDDGRARWILTAFVVGAVVNALGSLAQAAGATLFATTLVTGRADTGAFLGNEGHVAQLAALALVAAGIAAWRAATAAGRAAAFAATLPLLAALVVNRNLTALATAAAGGALVLLLARGRRGLVGLVLAAVVLAGAVVAYAPMRARLGEAVQAFRAGDWDALTTYRLGPWSAAVEMVRARPLVGFGPGTFGAEFAPHRMRAELRQQRRLVIPLFTSSFAEAHSDFLQAAAECGIATALACVVAAATLFAALVPLAGVAPGTSSAGRDPASTTVRARASTAAPAAGHIDAQTEALVVTALLGATALAALTWFPLQLPVVMVPLLLAAGRGWRLLASSATNPRTAASVASMTTVASTPTSPASPRLTSGAIRALAFASIVALAALVAPELARYAAEHRLARITGTLEGVIASGRLVPEARARLAELATVASADAAHAPADTRALVAAGTAMLVAGDAPAARGHYRAALARGERAEIDLNLARAFAIEGRREDGEAALLRAAWLSPTLLAVLPEADRARVEARLADLETRLRRGELEAPPPLPDDEAVPAGGAPPGVGDAAGESAGAESAPTRARGTPPAAGS